MSNIKNESRESTSPATSKEPKDQPKEEPKKEKKGNSKEQSPESCAKKLTVEDAFVAHTIFPSPAAAFSFLPPPVTDVYKHCAIVLDTNVLLLPYRAGASSLAQIKIVFTQLCKDERLFIPSQVAREFARHRPLHVADLYKAISDRLNRVAALDKFTYPLLEDIKEYQELSSIYTNLESALIPYNKAIKDLLGSIKSWKGNDPVSIAYKAIFAQKCVCEPIIDKEVVLQEMEKRFAALIPPGYKDGSKHDGGIGDYLIWLTILDIGKTQKKPLIFVTGEEKADWHHRSAGQGLLPRYELVDEYRRASGNQPFYILSLSDLLELAKAPKQIVDEIRTEESKSREQQPPLIRCPCCASVIEYERNVDTGSSVTLYCQNCGNMFIASRAINGLLVTQSHIPVDRRACQNIDHITPISINEVGRRIANMQKNNIVFSSDSATISANNSSDKSSIQIIKGYTCNRCGNEFVSTDARCRETGIFCNSCLGQRDIDVFG